MKISLFSLLFISLSAFSVSDTSRKLSWAAPTEREDGSKLSLSEIQNFRAICWNNDIRIYDDATIPNTATTTSVTIPLGANGCKMTTIDTDSQESVFSNMVAFTIKPAVPNPPVLQ